MTATPITSDLAYGARGLNPADRNFSIVVAVSPLWARGNFPNFPDLLRFIGSIAMSEHRPWTEEDFTRLRSMAGKFSSEEIAKALARGLPATKVKAHQLKVSLSIHRRRSIRADEQLSDPHA
jgi:hypothetical protein